MKTEQMEKDIAYCIDNLELSNDQIGEILRAVQTEQLEGRLSDKERALAFVKESLST